MLWCLFLSLALFLFYSFALPFLSRLSVRFPCGACTQRDSWQPVPPSQEGRTPCQTHRQAHSVLAGSSHPDPGFLLLAARPLIHC